MRTSAGYERIKNPWLCDFANKSLLLISWVRLSCNYFISPEIPWVTLGYGYWATNGKLRTSAICVLAFGLPRWNLRTWSAWSNLFANYQANIIVTLEINQQTVWLTAVVPNYSFQDRSSKSHLSWDSLYRIRHPLNNFVLLGKLIFLFTLNASPPQEKKKYTWMLCFVDGPLSASEKVPLRMSTIQY